MLLPPVPPNQWLFESITDSWVQPAWRVAMGLIYDDPRLAALTLTRIAAKESERPQRTVNVW